MREAPSLKCLCAALFAVCCLTLSTVPLAHAGKGKPNVVRTSGQHVKGGHGSAFDLLRHSRQGRHKRKRFDKHDRRLSFVKRQKHKRRHAYVPTYYYGYRRGNRYRDYTRSEPSYRPEKTEVVQPFQDRPVTPKWVHVGSLDSSPLAAKGGGPGRNCLSVKTEITVDGELLDAFGQVCLLADGTWELRPSEQAD